jgi:type II secretory pathway component PulJ
MRGGGGFTLIELMLASALSVLLIGGVLFSLAALSRDAAVAETKIQSGNVTATLDLLQWDLTNARSVSQSPDHRTLVLVGHGAIGPDTLRPNGRLVRVVYSCSTRGNVWRLTRQQQYLDDPARPQGWTELVSETISSIQVLPAASAPLEEDGPMPQWVRLRVYGPNLAVEKTICVK